MKVLRKNGQCMLDGFIESVRLNEDGNAEVRILTSARLTCYRLVITKQDMHELKLLLHAVSPEESLI